MNRFSEILNESTDFEELENKITPISDILGKPNVATVNFGDEVGYIFKWNLGFNITQYNGESEIDQIHDVFNAIRRLNVSIRTTKDYDIDFKIDEFVFFVRMTPKSQNESQSYKFIVGQNWRNIILDYGQIARFFKDRGFKVRSTKINDNEINESSDVTITTDADMIAINQFETLFNQEVDFLYNEEESLNRNVVCNTHGSVIYIYPEEDKTFVVFNQEL